MEAGRLKSLGWRLEAYRGQDGGWKSSEARMEAGSLERPGWRLEVWRGQDENRKSI